MVFLSFLNLTGGLTSFVLYSLRRSFGGSKPGTSVRCNLNSFNSYSSSFITMSSLAISSGLYFSSTFLSVLYFILSKEFHFFKRSVNHKYVLRILSFLHFLLHLNTPHFHYHFLLFLLFFLLFCLFFYLHFYLK